MNILQMEDMVKGLPDQVLMQEAQMPSGQIPQFLALSEVQRRKEMRDKFQAPPQATVADQILQGGIASAMPQQPPQGGMAPPQGPPPGGPPGPQGPVMAYGGGRMPYGMYGGGMVPYRMQEGRTVPGFFSLQHQLPGLYTESGELKPSVAAVGEFLSPRRGEFSIVREAQALESQGRIDEAISLLSQNRLDPRKYLKSMPSAAALTPPAAAPAAAPVTAPAPASSEPVAVPGQVDMMATLGLSTPSQTAMPPAPGMPPAGGTTPTAGTDINSMMAEITSAMGPAYAAIAPVTGGSTNFSKEFDEIRKLQEQQAGIKTDFSPFAQQIQQRGEESVKRYEQSIKDIEDRMKKERLGAVLTTLGANLMAGEGALGLEKAGKLAQEMGREARQEVAAERRLMEAAREGSADKMLSLQIQQVTSDADAQRNVLNAKTDLQKLILQTNLAQGTEARQARRDAMQLAATLTSSTVGRLKSLEEQNALNTRSFVTAMSAESETILKLLEQMTTLTDPKEKIKMYNQLMESKIRGYGALYPNIDINPVIAAFKQDTGGTGGTGAQSGSSRFNVQVFNPGR